MDNFNDLPFLDADTTPDYLLGFSSKNGWGRIAVNNLRPMDLVIADKMAADDTPLLVMGADHALPQWQNNGMAQVYADCGIFPYLAVNTQDDAGEYVGATNRMTAAQVKQVQDSGVEILTHGSQHVQSWNLINTGIKITYLGAGTFAALTVTGTWPNITIASSVSGAAGDNFSLDTTLAANDTLAELKIAIEATNGGGKWSVRLSPELTGNELSNNLACMKGGQTTTFSNSGGKVLGTYADDMPTGTAVLYHGGTMPDSLTADTWYYAVKVSATTCRFATTRALALADVAGSNSIAYVSTSGTGTITGYQTGMIAKPVAFTNTSPSNTCLIAVGGGITLQYTGTAYKTAYYNILNSNVLELYGDGVLLSSLSLSGAAQDTLRKLCTVVNAISGWSCKLMDNDQVTTASNQSYINGNELSVRLNWVGGIDALARPQNCEIGLSTSYMISRMVDESISTLATSGITIKNFAQSGTAFYPWLQHGAQSCQSFRGNPYIRTSSIAPLMTPCNERPDFFRVVYAVNLEVNGGPSITQMYTFIDALCDTRGYMVDFLIHCVLPDGTTGYNFPSLVNSTYSIKETDFVALCRYIGVKIATGQLRSLPPNKARTAIKLCPAPVNRVLNPRFRNTGISFLGNAGGNVVDMPGWAVYTPVGITAFTPRVSDNSILITSDAASGAVPVMRQEHLFISGKTYIYEVDIDVVSYTSGNGVYLQSAKRALGMFKDMQPHTSNTVFKSDTRTRGGRLALTFTVPKKDDSGLGYVRSLTKGPWDLSAAGNATMKVNLAAKGVVDNISVVGATPATTHADEIATLLNAAIRADAAYRELQEYWTAFSAEDGYLVGRLPWRYNDNTGLLRIDAGTTNGGATLVVFGNAQVRGVNFQAANPTAGDFIVQMNLVIDGVMTIRVRNPMIREEMYP